MRIIVEREEIDFFQGVCDKLLTDIFELNPADVLVTDISSVLDFSYTQAELDSHVLLIKEQYGIDLSISKDYGLLSLCRLIELKSKIRLH